CRFQCFDIRIKDEKDDRGMGQTSDSSAESPNGGMAVDHIVGCGDHRRQSDGVQSLLTGIVVDYLLPFFKWSDASWIGVTVRSSRLYFPIIETFHLLALTLLFGAIVMLNLRLCGLVMKNLPVRQVSRDLSPWLLWSLVAILATGFVLFTSEAMK